MYLSHLARHTVENRRLRRQLGRHGDWGDTEAKWLILAVVLIVVGAVIDYNL